LEIEIKEVDELEIINFENDVELLSKDELGAALNLDKKEIRKNKKSVLVTMFLSKHSDEVSKRKMYKNYSSRFALHPTKVQELFNITSTERKRWTGERKLKVDHYDSFQKWGKTIEYPMYDAFELSKLSQETIELWREEHKTKVRENRKKASKKPVETMRKNQDIRREFYDSEWKKLLRQWFKTNSELGATFQLSFWTMWLSRWAKEFQSKACRAKTKGNEYNQKKEQFYQLKNDALALLVLSPYTKLSFYCPPSPHKIFDLQFCSNHYELWCSLREFEYIPKWEFFEDYKNVISNCNDCTFSQVDHYYSLYYLSVESGEFPEFDFSFHTPYPIGEVFFPPKDTLNSVLHEEQEGMFRFGRTLFDDEKIIFTEKEVLKHFNEARQKYLLYFPTS
jgi:hypothetical protein